MKVKIAEKDEKIKNLNEKLKQCEGISRVESPFLRQLIEAHLRNKDAERPQSRQWTFDDKMLCLNLLKRSVPTYQFLNEQEPTCFPSERTLQRIFSEITMDVGIDEDLLEALGKKMKDLDPRAVYVSLETDEYAIKPVPTLDESTDKIYGYQNYGKDLPERNTSDIANKCLVFMIQGLFIPFKQPIAYYFNKGGINGADLKTLTLLIISKLRKYGIIVKAFVSDQAKPNCLAMDELRGIEKKKKNCPCLPAPAAAPNVQQKNQPKIKCICRQRTQFIADGETIYIIPDAPHEWKCIKANWTGDFETWMKNNKKNFENDDDLKFAYPGCKLSIDGTIGAWSDLVLLYRLKKMEGCTVWNDQMMFPGSRDKMRVKWTVRLSSKNTAEDLKSKQFLAAKKIKDSENPPTEVWDTAKVILLLNEMCDVTNGPSKTDKKQCPERYVVTKHSYHWKKWEEFTKLLE